MKGIPDYFRHLIQIIKFYFCGILTACIVWGILFILHFLNVEYLICVNIATFIGIICSFFLNKYFVFKSSGKFIRELFDFFLRQIPLIVLANILFFTFISVLSLSFVFSAIVIIPLISVINYILTKRLFCTNAGE